MIHALPGMGADGRMYPSPWDSLPGFVAHDWPRHKGERTLTEMARAVSELYNIRDDDSLVGVSLGGMVACEIAKIRKIRTVYLVGSATRKEEVSGVLAALRPLATIAPFGWLQFSAGKIPTDITQMFASNDASFIRAMCAAVFQWEGLGSASVQVVRIHGKHDLVIPPPSAVDFLLDGGHLISMSHAQECTEFIRGWPGAV